jgi:hypothetical protein
LFAEETGDGAGAFTDFSDVLAAADAEVVALVEVGAVATDADAVVAEGATVGVAVDGCAAAAEAVVFLFGCEGMMPATDPGATLDVD